MYILIIIHIRTKFDQFMDNCWLHKPDSFILTLFPEKFIQNSKNALLEPRLQSALQVNGLFLSSFHKASRKSVQSFSPDPAKSQTTCVELWPRLLPTWHHNLVAGHTLGGELVAVAVVAEQRVVLAGEGLVRQRAVAAETAEAVLVVMSLLVEELLEEKHWRLIHTIINTLLKLHHLNCVSEVEVSVCRIHLHVALRLHIEHPYVPFKACRRT